MEDAHQEFAADQGCNPEGIAGQSIVQCTRYGECDKEVGQQPDHFGVGGVQSTRASSCLKCSSLPAPVEFPAVVT